MIKYKKLVRDRILKILKKSGVGHKYHIAKNDAEYLEKLYEKLQEEIGEFREDPSVEEFADILQVLESITKFHKFDLNDIKEVKSSKRYNKGGFHKMFVLDDASDK